MSIVIALLVLAVALGAYNLGRADERLAQSERRNFARLDRAIATLLKLR